MVRVFEEVGLQYRFAVRVEIVGKHALLGRNRIHSILPHIVCIILGDRLVGNGSHLDGYGDTQGILAVNHEQFDDILAIRVGHGSHGNDIIAGKLRISHFDQALHAYGMEREAGRQHIGVFDFDILVRDKDVEVGEIFGNLDAILEINGILFERADMEEGMIDSERRGVFYVVHRDGDSRHLAHIAVAIGHMVGEMILAMEVRLGSVGKAASAEDEDAMIRRAVQRSRNRRILRIIVVIVVVAEHTLRGRNRQLGVFVHRIAVLNGNRIVIRVNKRNLERILHGCARRINRQEGNRRRSTGSRIRLALEPRDIAHGIALRALEVHNGGVGGHRHRDVQVVAIGILEDILEANHESIAFVERLGTGTRHAGLQVRRMVTARTAEMDCGNLYGIRKDAFGFDERLLVAELDTRLLREVKRPCRAPAFFLRKLGERNVEGIDGSLRRHVISVIVAVLDCRLLEVEAESRIGSIGEAHALVSAQVLDAVLLGAPSEASASGRGYSPAYRRRNHIGGRRLFNSRRCSISCFGISVGIPLPVRMNCLAITLGNAPHEFRSCHNDTAQKGQGNNRKFCVHYIPPFNFQLDILIVRK